MFIDLGMSDSSLANFLEKILVKSKYLAGIMISLASNKAIWAFLDG